MKHLLFYCRWIGLLLSSFMLLSPAGFSCSKDQIKVMLDSFIPNDVANSASQYKNMPLQVDKKRALKLLNNDQINCLLSYGKEQKKALALAPNDLVVANFWTNNQFYIAKFHGIKAYQSAHHAADIKFKVNNSGAPLVSEISFVKEAWNAKSNPNSENVEVHSFLKFKGPQITLLAVQPNNSDGQSAQLVNQPFKGQLILSIEAIRPKAHPDLGFMPSALNFNFNIAHLVYDFQQLQRSNTAHASSIYSCRPLNFNQNQKTAGQWTASNLLLEPGTGPKVAFSPKTALLLEGIKRSLVDQRFGAYNLFLSNCTNFIFNAVDKVLGLTPSSINYKLVSDDAQYFLADELPSILPKYLEGTQAGSLPRQVIPLLTWYNNKKDSFKSTGSIVIPPNVVKLLAAMPPFITSQLKARGLITKAKEWVDCKDVQ